MESGFLYPEAVFPVLAKNEVIQSNAIDIFADDVIETENHFRCIDMIIAHAKATLTEKRI